MPATAETAETAAPDHTLDAASDRRDDTFLDTVFLAACDVFDGRHVAALRPHAARLDPSDATVRRALLWADTTDEIEEIASTWILKDLVERRQEPLPPRLGNLIVLRLEGARHHHAALHLLQCLPSCELGSRALARLRDLLPELVEDTTDGFTRAWAFNAWAELGRRDRRYRDEAVAVLTAAQERERPAVRARIRHALAALED